MALWLLLLSIITHAFVPADSSLQTAPGSAFSAATTDVAVGPPRLVAEYRLAPDRARDGFESADGPDPAALSLVAGEALVPGASGGRSASPAIAAIPVRDAGLTPFAPRAPPSI